MIEVKNKLQLTPQLILTPQLKLILKVMQLNVLELNEYLLQETQSNPFLEIEFNDLPSDLPETVSSDKKEIELTDEYDWSEQNLFERPQISFAYETPEEDENLIEKTLRAEESLSDHIKWQLGFIELTPLERDIAEYLIGNLDERGYLRISPEVVARDLGVSKEKVEVVREKIKKLDPVGIASLDLRECLLAQLEVLGYSSKDLPWILVDRYLPELAKDLDSLSKLINRPLEEIKNAMDVIRSLEPYPARNFFTPKNVYVEPDLRFYKEDDEWKVEVLKDRYFQVRLSNLYYKFINQRRIQGDAKSKEFLKEKLRDAENLLKALDSRYSTLYKVGYAILHAQRDFFEKGFQYLKPLTLKDLSLVTNLHESTISRVISHKYVDTPFGIFPLKFFFSTGYQTKIGESLSATAIKSYIKEIVSSENPEKPLSDSQISKILQERYGIKIARRTITKYREELNIPSIRERKRRNI